MNLMMGIVITLVVVGLVAYLVWRSRDPGVRIAWAVALLVAVTIGLTGCGRPQDSKQVTVPPNPQKEMALTFYQEMMNGDRGKAWDMMHPMIRGGSRELFVELYESSVLRHQPTGVTVQEWRRPQQEGYTYLIRAKDVDPWVVVISGNESKGYSVLEYRIYEGGELP